jgi:hypothetical protein
MLRADKQVYLYEHQTKIQDKCCYHITTSDYNGDHLVIVLFCVLIDWITCLYMEEYA